MRKFIRMVATAAACAVATAASAEILTTAVDIPTGAVIDLSVEKNSERSGSTQSKMTATFRYKQAIQSTDEGYVVTQTLVGIDAPAEAKAALQEAAGAVKTITFEADASLAPTKVRDRKAVSDALFGSMTALMAGQGSPERTAEAVAKTRALFEGMNDEQLAQVMLKEQFSLSQFQSMEIDLTEPVTEVMETQNPLGGGPIKRTVTIKLDRLDKAAQRATISLTDVLDPEGLNASAMALVERLAPEQRERVAGEMAAGKMELRNACRYEMDLKSGLAARTDCTQTVVAVDGEGKVERKVDRTVITQKLTLP